MILRKLNLSERFPRKVLYMRNSALGVGLMAPRTIVDVLALKLYVGHQRARSKVAKIIQINEDNARMSYGYSASIIETSRKWKPNNVIWSDEIQEMLNRRQLKVMNRANEPKWITKNKTIMDYVKMYVKMNQISELCIAPINQVRIQKKMYLPCELIGLNGKHVTKEAKETEHKSNVEWNIEFEEVPKPSKKSYELWKKFVEWIIMQDIVTIVDFEPNIRTKYEIGKNGKYLKENVNDKVIYYEKDEIKYGQQLYKKTDEVRQNEWKKIIAEMKPNQSIVVYGTFHVHMEETEIRYFPFNNEITKSIQENKAVAATDASVKDDEMGGVWMLTDTKRTFEISNELYHKRWGDNTPGVAEFLVLLELITVIERRGRHISNGKITIGFDNKKHHRNIVNEVNKSNVYALEAGAEISEIKRKLRKIKFEVQIIWNRGHEVKIGTYEQNPTKHLIRECDARARKGRELIRKKKEITNVKFYGNYGLKRDDGLQSRSTNEIIRIIDAKKVENEYIKKKYGYKNDFIDIEARNAFRVGKVTTSMIKCAHGYNHYGQRDAMINENMVEATCPRCEMIETWEHVVQCRENSRGRKAFAKDLVEKLMKKKPKEVKEEVVMSFVEDIMKYVRNEEEGEYKTNQQYVGMKELFRGYVVRNGEGADYNERKYSQLNKIVVKTCVEYYAACWKERNIEHHDEVKQRKRVVKWHANMMNKVENSVEEQLRKYVQKHNIEVDKCKTETIRRWINNVKEFERKMERTPKDDIRRYFMVEKG